MSVFVCKWHFWWRQTWCHLRETVLQCWAKFSNIFVRWSTTMISAKNYKTVSKFVKVMPKILWPLFFPDTAYTWPMLNIISHAIGDKRNLKFISSGWDLFESHGVAQAVCHWVSFFMQQIVQTGHFAQHTAPEATSSRDQDLGHVQTCLTLDGCHTGVL